MMSILLSWAVVTNYQKHVGSKQQKSIYKIRGQDLKIVTEPNQGINRVSFPLNTL